ncbi:phosphoribosylanthranilate isomerase [Xanthomonas euvesicatoria]|uniref:phosphoribosylanthranilate isomerase n=1 Tax=Xanthomonas euvesicatoria TaxID=456327 RepID=UPI0026E3E460|nr:phosphoribosylanthranilate isomerase [Xanthomonas euvesicatoria]MDO7941101.1 phosphoribosylanthranilate isomerase [Xanthomonas euvesicatoria pv. eucalypti]MDO7962469.1 phosphoribosylanthranilate isomerase [Xanthomonas euvesicatoria pv. eucalypti]
MNRSLYRTRIKFCGMTRAGDIRLAGELGVDAVGFIFAHGSPRRVAPAAARAMRQATAPMVDVVALFRNNSKEEVREVVRTVRPTLLQFHGEEDDAFCRSFNLPYLKAVPMGSSGVNGEDANARTLQLSYPNTAGFLFDSHAPGAGGGTGKTFDWSRLPTGLHRPFLLAGGINADNVFDAIVATLPWGVDVSSGVELAPGIKDGHKMRKFVEEVRRADCHDMS